MLHQAQELHHAKIDVVAIRALHGADVGRVKDEQAAGVGCVLGQESGIGIACNFEAVKVAISDWHITATQ